MQDQLASSSDAADYGCVALFVQLQVTASKDVNADLLAMIRGGGPTLGIITELTMRLADVSNYHGVSISARDPDFQQLRYLHQCKPVHGQ